MTKKGETGKDKARRPYGTGSITLREDGRLQGNYYDSQRKRHSIYQHKGESRSAFAQRLNSTIEKSKRGELVPVDRITVAEYMHEWLNDTKKLGYRANSYVQREQAIRLHIAPDLGDIQLQKLTQRQIQRWVRQLSEEKKLTGKTIDAYYGALYTGLEDAVKAGTLAKNPAQGVTLPPILKAEHLVLDPIQCKAFLTSLEDHKWLHPIITLALVTTMRKAELVSLRWSDVDLQKGTLHVRHNVAYIGRVGWVEGPPKSKSSARCIALPEFVVQMLKTHRLTVKEKRLAAGPANWQDKDLVFPGKVGGFIPFATLDSALDSALKKADLPIIPFHSLRHSAASLLLSMGVPPKVVQTILGHSSIMMTMDLYGHLFPGQQEEAMSKMHAMFAGGVEEAGDVFIALQWVRAKVAECPDDPGGQEVLKVLMNIASFPEAIS